MPKLTINDKEVVVEDGLTIIQACKAVEIEIPHFCFHEKLKIAGNCRMCLVEVEKAPKLVASCAMNVAEGMKIYTNSHKVENARKGVMEFLLINHPLDCPICDQGGECDLQDQAFKYGKRISRFTENKRAVKDKNLGPLIKTSMNRCIHCTRCVRFATDVAGVPEIGALGRGEDMEITNYLEQTLTSELSGNIIDLCPVGALTSKPYAFTARSWELNKTESIDVMDAIGSHIRIDSKGIEVMRILPNPNEAINEEWISDKARFSYDGLKVQRIDSPYIKINGKLIKSDWDSALKLAANKISESGNNIAAIAGPLVSCEPMFLLKKLFSKLGSNLVDANQYGYEFDTKMRGNYLFNTTIAGIESADLCLIIGANIRKSAPVLNARIGKMVRSSNMVVAAIGETGNQTYKIENLGQDLSILTEIEKGVHIFTKKLKSAKKPMIIIGDGIYSRRDSKFILETLYKISSKYGVITEDWNGYNILHNHANIVGALDLGFLYQDGSGVKEILEATHAQKVKLLYLLNADDIDMSQIDEKCFVIYQGHHGGKGAERADLILPEASYVEQDGIYVNLEGRPQYARRAVPPPGLAKPSIEIIFELAKYLKQDLGDEKLQSVREQMTVENDIFGQVGNIIKSQVYFDSQIPTELSELQINIPSKSYYMDNIICKYSQSMAKCSNANEQMLFKQANLHETR
ncbi:MAG: NADH-quinone oxidoreductase subunit G [Rickettsiaceae bacterium]|nr:NADH-quinone oxidoreductase subunit G [Rickettsiaceae bacterium]